MTPEELAQDEFTGDSKLARPWPIQVLNDFLHTLIALGTSYATVLLLAFLLSIGAVRLGYPLSILAGTITGYSALFFRETLQFLKTKKLHWKDRLRDVLPGIAGAVGGLLAWFTATHWFL